MRHSRILSPQQKSNYKIEINSMVKRGTFKKKKSNSIDAHGQKMI